MVNTQFKCKVRKQGSFFRDIGSKVRVLHAHSPINNRLGCFLFINKYSTFHQQPILQLVEKSYHSKIYFLGYLMLMAKIYILKEAGLKKQWGKRSMLCWTIHLKIHWYGNIKKGRYNFEKIGSVGVIQGLQLLCPVQNMKHAIGQSWKAYGCRHRLLLG